MKMFSKQLLALAQRLGLYCILALLPVSVLGQNIAVTHCQGACPQYASNIVANQAKIVIHHVYAAGLNNDSGMPDWVAYHLSSDAVGVASLLPRNWQSDSLLRFSDAGDLIEVGDSEFSLAQISADTSAYAGLGAPDMQEEETVRLAPMTSFANTPYWPELNNISNMVPMPANLRLGAWLKLEQALNQLVDTEEDLYVVSGPLFLISQPLSTSLQGTDFGPAAYYKIVSSDDGFLSFMFPENMQRYESFCDRRMALDQIEGMSGLNIFPGREPKESVKLLDALGCG